MAKLEVVEQEGMRFVKIGLANEMVRGRSRRVEQHDRDGCAAAVGRKDLKVVPVRAELAATDLHGNGRSSFGGLLRRLRRLRPQRRDLDPGKRQLLGVRGFGAAQRDPRAGLDLVLGR